MKKMVKQQNILLAFSVSGIFNSKSKKEFDEQF